MLPISICIIAKNEELHIEKCLKALTLFDWEIIFVDTGSTDNTINIASNHTNSVYHYKWINDFSSARNFAASKASFDWILSVDCDEYMKASNIESFHSWFSKNCTSDNSYLLGRFSLKNILSTDDCNEHTNEFVTRLYNRKHHHFQGKIHEQLVSNSCLEAKVIDIPLEFEHMGYSTTEIRIQKANRNLELLLKQLETTPPTCYLYYQTGQCFFSKKDYKNALTYYEKALDIVDFPFPSYVQTLVISYGYTLLELHLFQKALNLIQNDLYSYFSHHADYVFLAGLIYMNNGLFSQAINEFLKATTIQSYSSNGVNSYKAFYNIGVIYECSGDISTAIAFYKKCSHYPPAIQRINALKP